MKNFVKEVVRYLKLPFKFMYWIIGVLSFLFFIIYVFFKKNKPKMLRQYKKSVLCVSHVAISFDGRIKKCANQIVLLGLPVTLIKPYDAQEKKEFEYSGLDRRVRVRKIGLSGSFSHFPYIFDLFMLMHLILCDDKFIHCHDLNTAFMGLVASKITGKILISDLHEWKSETGTLHGKKENFFQIKLFKLMEKLIVRESDFVITVNEIIARELNQTAKREREIFIVKNCPRPSQVEKYNVRQDLKLPKEHIIGYYVGQISPYRNLSAIIRSIRNFPRLILVFRGTIDETYLQNLVTLCEEEKVVDRVFFLPPVQHDHIPSTCQGADFGIFSCSTHSKNMYSSLPNKLFEYIAGGLPILAEDVPLMREYIEKYNIGTLFQSNDTHTICKAFELILNNDVLQTMRSNTISLRDKLLDEVNTETSSVYARIYQS